jgi:hypothetical protein
MAPIDEGCSVGGMREQINFNTLRSFTEYPSGDVVRVVVGDEEVAEARLGSTDLFFGADFFN